MFVFEFLASLDPSTRAVVVSLGLAGLYVLSTLIFPLTACGACADGKHHSPSAQNWRSCRKCRGSGKKLRLIPRLLGRSS